MAYTLQPWQVFLTALEGWINRHQQAAIDFLREENRVLLEQLGERRVRLTDDQRRRLAVAGKAVGRKALADLAGLVTPDTILAWHRKLVAAKWDQREKRRGPGRPGVMKAIERLVVRFSDARRDRPLRLQRRSFGRLGDPPGDPGLGVRGVRKERTPPLLRRAGPVSLARRGVPLEMTAGAAVSAPALAGNHMVLAAAFNDVRTVQSLREQIEKGMTD